MTGKDKSSIDWLHASALDRKHEEYVQKRKEDDEKEQKKKMWRQKNVRADLRNRFQTQRKKNYQAESKVGVTQRGAPTEREFQKPPHESWRARQKKDWRFYRRTGNLWDDPYHIPPDRRKVVIHRKTLESEIQFIEKVRDEVVEKEIREKQDRTERIAKVKALRERMRFQNLEKAAQLRTLSDAQLHLLEQLNLTSSALLEGTGRPYPPAPAVGGAPEPSLRLQRLSRPKESKPKLETFKKGSSDFRGLIVVDDGMADLIESYERVRPFNTSIVGQGTDDTGQSFDELLEEKRIQMEARNYGKPAANTGMRRSRTHASKKTVDDSAVEVEPVRTILHGEGKATFRSAFNA